MSENVKIRKAILSDLPDIVAIYNSSIPSRIATATLKPVTTEEWTPWLIQREKHHPVWVMEDEAGQVGGWMSLSPHSAKEAYDATAAVSVYIAEAWRNLGLGGWLLDQLLEMAPALGLRRLIAQIFAHNRASLALFRRAGFEEWGYLPGVAVMDGIERDVITMGIKVI